MSRSHNEKSIPNQRGRKQALKTKRRSSKKIRRIPIDKDIDSLTEKKIRASFVIDKDALVEKYKQHRDKRWKKLNTKLEK